MVLFKQVTKLESLLWGTSKTMRLLAPTAHSITQSAGKKLKYFPDRDLKVPENFQNIAMPEKNRLPIMPKTPNFWSSGPSMRPPRHTRELWRMKGEDTVNNELQLNQFAIIALNGGLLKHKHFEAMRLGIGRHLKGQKLFGLYRVDAPYKPITNHGQGKKMGGGKGSISEYATPVRAGRVIVEVGGEGFWEEVHPWLRSVANKLPFDAIAVNAEILTKLRDEEKKLTINNQNPVSFEWLIRNNMFDCQRKLSDYDQKWFGKFVYHDRQLNKKWQWVLNRKYKGKY